VVILSNQRLRLAGIASRPVDNRRRKLEEYVTPRDCTAPVLCETGSSIEGDDPYGGWFHNAVAILGRLMNS
jgi:hypothetical protein